MNKNEFFEKLRKGLSGLPKKDIDEHITFYGEMIDDRIEEGIPEETAVSELGTIDEIVSEIIADTPIKKLIKEKINSKSKLKIWEIILILLGSPIWLPLMIAVIAIFLSVYIVLWSLIISLWAVFVSVIAGGLSGVATGILFIIKSYILTGIAVIGFGLFCFGLSVFMFFGFKVLTKYFIVLTKKIAIFIKNCIINKEES